MMGRSRDAVAVDIARGRVAANQIIDAPGRSERASDARGRRPDHLGVMPNVLPIARPAVVREGAGREIAFLRRPTADHRLGREGAVRSHPQVLADPATRLTVRML